MRNQDKYLIKRINCRIVKSKQMYLKQNYYT